MTEKRFNRVGGYVYDGEHCISHFEDVTHRDDIVTLLNELHETIERLKQNITELLSVDIEEELLEENEQLKSALKELKEIGDYQADRIKELFDENEQLKFENNELKCALALDEVEYIIADGKKIDIPPYYEFEQRYDSVMHRREYDGYD